MAAVGPLGPVAWDGEEQEGTRGWVAVVGWPGPAEGRQSRREGIDFADRAVVGMSGRAWAYVAREGALENVGELPTLW